MKKLFLDKLTGKNIKRKDHISIHYQNIFYDCFEYLKMDSFTTGFDKVYIEPVARAYSKRMNISIEESFSYIKKILVNDNVMKNSMTSLMLYQKNKTGNYIISKNLKNCLEKCSVDVSSDLLPSNRNLYLEIPDIYDNDGCKIECLFANIGDYSENERPLILSGYSINAKGECFNISTRLDLKRGKSIKEAYMAEINNYKVYGGIKGDSDFKQSKENLEYKDRSWQKTAINALLYISSSSEDLIFEKNEFATKRSKRAAQEKIYTKEEFCEVGKDFVFVKLLSEEEHQWSGHFRWQPCGKERKEIKLTWVKPHKKKISRKIIISDSAKTAA